MGSDDDPSSRPLTDDPDFLDSLSHLDDGLSGGRPPASPALKPATGSVAPPLSADRRSQQLADLSNFLSKLSGPNQGLPSGKITRAQVVTAPGRRPLLDLFPFESEQPPAAPTLPRETSSTSQSRRRLAHVLTYETFYGLSERPFGLSSDLKFLYHSGEYDRITQEMLGAIGRHEGFVMLTGELGVGKSTLCHALLEQLDRRTLTSFIAEPCESVADLLKRLLIDFGVISESDVANGQLTNATQAELAGVLRHFLSSLAALQAFAVVIIDEAQNLPASMLEEIRLVGEAGGDERLMQIVLVGQPDLLAGLARPELRQLSESLVRRCKLGPLGSDEIAGYVMHRLRVAGDNPRVEFDDAALARLYKLSGGMPRLANLLCERALASGFTKSASVIDEALIEEAAADLDLAAPVARVAALRAVAIVALMVWLFLLGAAASAYVYRDALARLVVLWENVPSPPKAPTLPVPEPYSPPAVPLAEVPAGPDTR